MANLDIAISLYGWDKDKFNKTVMSKADTAITMLGKGDDYVSKNERKFDSLFESGKSDEIVYLIVQAAKADPSVKRNLEKSRFVNFDDWKKVKVSKGDKVATELVRMAKEILSKDADTQYQYKFRAVEKKLDDIKKILKKHREEQSKNYNDWGYVGDLGKIEIDLEDMIRFLS